MSTSHVQGSAILSHGRVAECSQASLLRHNFASVLAIISSGNSLISFSILLLCNKIEKEIRLYLEQVLARAAATRVRCMAFLAIPKTMSPGCFY